jgi:hypothetical protein
MPWQWQLTDGLKTGRASLCQLDTVRVTVKSTNVQARRCSCHTYLVSLWFIPVAAANTPGPEPSATPHPGSWCHVPNGISRSYAAPSLRARCQRDEASLRPRDHHRGLCIQPCELPEGNWVGRDEGEVSYVLLFPSCDSACSLGCTDFNEHRGLLLLPITSSPRVKHHRPILGSASDRP